MELNLKFSAFAHNMISDTDRKYVIDYINSKDYIENKANQYFTVRNRFLSDDTNIDVLEVFVNENGLIFIFDIDYLVENVTL